MNAEEEIAKLDQDIRTLRLAAQAARRKGRRMSAQVYDESADAKQAQLYQLKLALNGSVS